MKRSPSVAIPSSRIEYDHERAHDEAHRRYTQGPWLKLTRRLKWANPMCCKIQPDGSACRFPSVLVHHLISPDVRPDLFLAVTNLVCLCMSCHPNVPGTPDWKVGVDYSATKVPTWTV